MTGRRREPNVLSALGLGAHRAGLGEVTDFDLAMAAWNRQPESVGNLALASTGAAGSQPRIGDSLLMLAEAVWSVYKTSYVRASIPYRLDVARCEALTPSYFALIGDS